MPGSERRVYIGNLPSNVRTKDLQDLFDKFGTIISTDLKGDRRSPFAFIKFEDPRDAEDAVKKRNGYNFDGNRIRVEFPRGGRSGGYGGGGGARSRSRSVHRVLVSGLPHTGSWQDLKDHFRDAGDVCFADVKDGHGVVEFVRYEDMKYAVTKLDDTPFRSHEGDSSIIRVKEERSRYKSRSRSRSYSPVRRRRDTRSPRVRRNPRSRSRSRSLSRSPARR